MKFSSIHVFGGARGIGRWFIEKVFQKEKWDIYIYDIDIPDDDSRLIENYHCKKIVLNSSEIVGIPEILENELVILAIPMHNVEELYRLLFPSLPDNTLVVDMSSAKLETSEILRKYSNGNLSTLGMHPMFSHLINHPAGQRVILTDYYNADERHNCFLRYLKGKGFLVNETSPLIHDKAMLVVQVLTHFTLLAFSNALDKSGLTKEQLAQFVTPPFQLLYSLSGRVVSGSSATYINIQSIKDSDSIRKIFVESAKSLENSLCEQESYNEKIKLFKAIGEKWTGSQVADAKSKSNFAIRGLTQFEGTLCDALSGQKVLGLEIPNGESIIACKITSIDEAFVELLVLSKETSKGIAVALNDNAVQNLKSIGIAIKCQKISYLKRNIRILSEVEFMEWVIEHTLTFTKDVSVESSVSLPEEFYETWLEGKIGGVKNIQFKEAYRKKGQSERITLTLEYFLYRTIQDIKVELEHYFELLNLSYTHNKALQRTPKSVPVFASAKNRDAFGRR